MKTGLKAQRLQPPSDSVYILVVGGQREVEARSVNVRLHRGKSGREVVGSAAPLVQKTCARNRSNVRDELSLL